MGRKLGHITFHAPGFKLVMARKEVRKDNGDLEVPPRLFRRIPDGWEELDDWGALPDSPSVKSLLKVLKRRRDEHCPKFRNPTPPYDPFFEVWPL